MLKPSSQLLASWTRPSSPWCLPSEWRKTTISIMTTSTLQIQHSGSCLFAWLPFNLSSRLLDGALDFISYRSLFLGRRLLLLYAPSSRNLCAWLGGVGLGFSDARARGFLGSCLLLGGAFGCNPHCRGVDLRFSSCVARLCASAGHCRREVEACVQSRSAVIRIS